MRILQALFLLVLAIPLASCGGGKADTTADKDTAPAPSSAPVTQVTSTTDQADPAKLAAARQLIAMTHSDIAVVQMMKQFSNSVGISMMNENPGKQEQVQQIIDQDLTPLLLSHTHELQENSAVVYARNFSLDDLNGIIAFYQSPVGQKYVQTTPQIMTETMRINRPLIVGVVAEASARLKQDLRKNNMRVPKELEQ